MLLKLIIYARRGLTKPSDNWYIYSFLCTAGIFLASHFLSCVFSVKTLSHFHHQKSPLCPAQPQPMSRHQTSVPDHVLCCAGSRQKHRYSATVMFLILALPWLAPHLLVVVLTYINIWWLTVNLICIIHWECGPPPCVSRQQDNFIFEVLNSYLPPPCKGGL